MESIRITPGFCPNCGSILPYLRASGNVKCYNCLTDWPPEGEFESFHLSLYIEFKMIQLYKINQHFI